MAGIPIIVQVMMDALADRLEGGARMISKTIDCFVGESAVADELGAIQERYPSVGIGSYPFFRDKQYGTSLVLRSVESDQLDEALKATFDLAVSVGGKPVERGG